MNKTLRLYTALLAVTICLQTTLPAISECDAPVLEASPQPEITAAPEATPSPTPETTAFPEATEMIESIETPVPEQTMEAEITPEPTVSPEATPAPTPEASLEPEATPEISASPEASIEPEITPEATLNPDTAPEIEDEAPSSEEEIAENEEDAPKKKKKPRRDKRIGWKGVVQSDERGMAIPMLFQSDYKKVACYHRGTPKSVSTSGCGVTCVSMVIAYLTGNTDQNPYQLVFDNNYW